jgi:hypothetical protein
MLCSRVHDCPFTTKVAIAMRILKLLFEYGELNTGNVGGAV